MIKKIKTSKKTRMIVIIIFVFSLLIACSVKRKSDTISKIYLISSLPYFKDNKKFVYLRDSVGIIYYKNHILYEFPLHWSSQNSGDTTSFRQWIKYSYFLYNKNDFYGRYYDSINSNIYKTMAVDSLLSCRAFRGQSIFNKLEDHILLSSIKTQGNYSLIEKYKCKVKKDETYPDTTIVHYTRKMKEVEHTLSKDLDENKKMKVKKIRALYNPKVFKGISVPNYEIMFELKEDTVTNLEQYKLFIEKHKK